DVNNVDLWVGGLAEDHARGSNVGPTFQRILVDQFTRTRDGDRFWYQNYLNNSELAMISGTTLTKVIQRDSGTFNLQKNAFTFDFVVSGSVYNDGNGNGRQDFRERGMAGETVQLLDDTGAVVDATKTNRNGQYSFDSVSLGQYFIKVDLPGGWQ